MRPDMLLTKRFLLFLATGLVSICGLAPHAASAQSAILPVVDKSLPGNPLEISGTVAIWEEIAGGRLQYSFEEHTTAKNISSKTILTVVAWVEAHNSYGRSKRWVKQYECFFAPDVIRPGESIMFSGPRRGTTSEPWDSSPAPHTPRAEARVLYVQFLDGSVYGSPSLARDILQSRRIAWRVLRQLHRTFERQGEEEYLRALNEPVDPPDVDAFIENLRLTQQQFGTPQTVAKIERMLERADERHRLIGGGGPPR